MLRAWEDGVRWQCLELPLPLNNAPAEGGWPGGIRQQVWFVCVCMYVCVHRGSLTPALAAGAGRPSWRFAVLPLEVLGL